MALVGLQLFNTFHVTFFFFLIWCVKSYPSYTILSGIEHFITF